MIANAWPDYYGPSGLGDPTADIADRCRAQGLPYGVIAQSETGKVAGTAALTGASYGAIEGEGVWIVGLLVLATARDKGVASALVQTLQDYASTQGYVDLYCTTVEAAGLLRRLGWHDLRTFQDNETHWRVLHKTILS